MKVIVVGEFVSIRKFRQIHLFSLIFLTVEIIFLLLNLIFLTNEINNPKFMNNTTNNPDEKTNTTFCDEQPAKYSVTVQTVSESLNPDKKKPQEILPQYCPLLENKDIHTSVKCEKLLFYF